MITCKNNAVTWGESDDGVMGTWGSWTAGRRGEHSLITMIGCYCGLSERWGSDGLVESVNEVGPKIFIFQMIGLRRKGFGIGPQREGLTGLSRSALDLVSGTGSMMVGGSNTDDGLIILLQRGMVHFWADKEDGNYLWGTHMSQRISDECSFAWESKQALRNIIRNRVLRNNKREKEKGMGGPDPGLIITVRWVWFWIEGWGVDHVSAQARVKKWVEISKVSVVWVRKQNSGNRGTWLNCIMADEMTKQMESLNFSEEVLADVGGELLGPQEGLEGSEKWLGIVFKSGNEQRSMTRREYSAENKTMGDSREQNRLDKGKAAISGGSRFRGAKRSLQGKNEVSHPLTTKRSKQGSLYIGAEEDEVSEASSPVKPLPTVEAASQPRREP
ncbi:hypothetical protein V6N13_083866 [Hibiscus sabdariffa]